MLTPLEVGTFRVDSPVARALGAQALEEETSTGFSFGFTARPRSNLSLTFDVFSVEIEERCYSLIARQAPMAGELRRIITVTKLVGELERSADLMINVCKAARRMYGSEISPKCRGIISGMSQEALKLLRMSIDSFADEDSSIASALSDIDDTLFCVQFDLTF